MPTEGGCSKAIFLKISKKHGISYARITQLATCNSDVRQNDMGQAQLLPKFLIYYDSKKFTCDVQEVNRSGFDKECLYNRVYTPPIAEILCVKNARAIVVCGFSMKRFFRKYPENLKKILGAVWEFTVGSDKDLGKS